MARLYHTYTFHPFHLLPPASRLFCIFASKIITNMKRTLYLAIVGLLLLLMNGTSMNAQTRKTVTKADRVALETWKNDHFGMFIHFGVYSQLEGVWKGEQIPFYGEQIMNHARIPVPEYEAVARTFNPVDFNADEVVALAKQAGMKYIVITTKHHDGFCMFDTKTTDYDIVDFTPYGKDVVGQLAEACHQQGMKLGFYYSLPDWHYPLGLPRVAPDTTTHCWEHVNQVYSPLEALTPALEDYIVAQITELLTQYGDITTLWFDMGLVDPSFSQRLRTTVKKLQPNCLINGRIMNNMGDYMTLPDNGNVASYGDVYWDNPASLYGTWGYKSWIRRPEVDKQVNTQLGRLTSTVSHGGVFLLNIGPDGTGKVIDYEKQVLQGIGDFLRAHPDTLDQLMAQSKRPNPPAPVLASSSDIVLTPDNGQYHAALDGTGYMSVETHSWLSWQVACKNDADYDVFVIYLPKNMDKTYQLRCGKQKINQILPGVDDMVQTCYMGSLRLQAGDNEVVLDQANRERPLEPLGLDLKQIILRKRK